MNAMNRDNGEHADGRTLAHWTVSTRDQRASPRSEVDDRVVRHLRRTVIDKLEHGEEPAPTNDLRDFRVRRNQNAPGGLFHATLFHEKAGDVLTICIHAGGPGAAEAWTHAWGDTGAPEPTPDGPWCVDELIDEGLLKLSPAQMIDVSVWSADFARCLAWTVIETDMS